MMWWPLQWLVIYILGGLTFVPLLVISVLGYVLTYGSVPIGDPDPFKAQKEALLEQAERDEQAAKPLEGTAKPLSGWLTVRRQFFPSAPYASSLFSARASTDLSGAEVKESEDEADKEKDKAATNGITPATTYSARIAQTYREVMDARKARKDSPPKEYLFCVLKGSVLFLYEDEAMNECFAAITVDKYVIGIDGRTGQPFEGKDAEMFAKRNSIVLRLRAEVDKQKGLPVLAKGMESNGLHKEEVHEMENAPWYLFSKSTTKTEDWYIALVQASALSPNTKGVFSFSDMKALVSTIDTEPDPIPMRWLNAMLGRVFFSLYRTQALEDFIIGKIMKKLSKVPRPNFLGPIEVREVNVGSFPPIFSKPMLKDLTAEGTAAFEMHMQYRSRPAQPNSEVRITITTTATIPTGFKPYVVDLVLAVVLKSIEGNMVIQVKKPPSNRVWYGFTHMPKMEVEILPIVSERRIQIGMILKAIEKQLREVIAESIVLPHMDDVAFFDTSLMPIRGAIFSDAGKKAGSHVLEPNAADPSFQPGLDVSPSVPEASSITPETTALRRRHPTKPETPEPSLILPSAIKGSGDESHDVGPPKTATASAHIAAASSWTRTTAVQAATREPAGDTAVASLPSASTAGSAVTSRVINRDAISAQTTGSDALNTVDVAHIPVSASAPNLAELPAGPTHTGSTTPKPEPTRQTSAVSESLNQSTVTAPDVPSPAEASSLLLPNSATTALIDSLRSRDKKAIQTQVNSARDAVRKWGLGFAAKHTRPVRASTPEGKDENGSEYRAGRSPTESPQTLHDRLTAAATIPPALPITVPGRDRSSSGASLGSAHRLSLQSSASRPGDQKAGSSSSPPKWTLSTVRPTTEVLKDEASASPSGTLPRPSTVANHTKTNSGTMVSQQPSGGKSMVVPRVRKRPGEVTGLGCSPGNEMIRQISTGEEGEKSPPHLPRGSGEDIRTGDMQAAKQDNQPPILSARHSSPGTAISAASPTDPVSDLDQPAPSSTSKPDPFPAFTSPPIADSLQRSDSAPSATLLLAIPPDKSQPDLAVVESPASADQPNPDAEPEVDAKPVAEGVVVAEEPLLDHLKDLVGNEKEAIDGPAPSAADVLRTVAKRHEAGRQQIDGEEA